MEPVTQQYMTSDFGKWHDFNWTYKE